MTDWPGRARELAQRFALRAARHDREASFPFENFDELREAGFFRLTVPRDRGGEGISLSECVRVIEEIAAGDGSTALGLTMHLIRLGGEAESPAYPRAWFDEMCRGAVEDGWLCNTAASEEGLGSPAGGGVPETEARPAADGWVLTGRKTFTTMAPVLHYFIVLAAVPGEGERRDIANFMVLRDDPDVRIDETWDSMGMRATGSHDLVLENVTLGPDRLLNRRAAGESDLRGAGTAAWFALGVAACSLGVARAARDYAVAFAKERTPKDNRTIKEYPGVRSRIARIDLLLHRSQVLLADAAAVWERREAPPEHLSPMNRVAVAKVDTLNNCIEAVDLAMRVVGGVSLLRNRPMERFYRDVRATLHNPPLEDRAMEGIARAALDGGEKDLGPGT